jgi:hypothetical protein
MQGKFISRIATELSGENTAQLAEYVLDTNNHHVLVVDSERYLSKFDYDGRLLAKNRIDKPWHRITAFAFHGGFLWATAETLEKDGDNPTSFLIKHKLYQLDANMNELYSQTLRTVNVGGNRLFSSLFVEELLADEQGVYAYATMADKKILLSDTLHIVQQKKTPYMYQDANVGMACIYPVRKGERFYLSTNNSHSTDNSSTFCYDDTTKTAYMLADGFRDDFFKTGYVPDLLPMDMYNETYCFLKSGKDLARKFPGRAENNDSPVLFILKLNV